MHVYVVQQFGKVVAVFDREDLANSLADALGGCTVHEFVVLTEVRND